MDRNSFSLLENKSRYKKVLSVVLSTCMCMCGIVSAANGTSVEGNNGINVSFTKKLKASGAKYKDLIKNFCVERKNWLMTIGGAAALAAVGFSTYKLGARQADRKTKELKMKSDLSIVPVGGLNIEGRDVESLYANQISSLKASIESLNNKINDLENKDGTLKTENAQLNNQLETLSNEKSNLQKQLKELNNKNIESQTQLQNSKAINDKLKADADKTQNELTAANETLKTTNAQLDGDLVEAKKSIVQLNNQLETLSNEKSNLQKQLVKLTKKSSELQNRLNNATIQINSLKDEKSDMQNSIAAERQKFADTNAQLQGQIQGLSDENTELKSEKDQFNKKFEALGNKNIELQEKCNKLESEKSKWMKKCTKYKGVANQAVTEIGKCRQNGQSNLAQRKECYYNLQNENGDLNGQKYLFDDIGQTIQKRREQYEKLKEENDMLKCQIGEWNSKFNKLNECIKSKLENSGLCGVIKNK